MKISFSIGTEGGSVTIQREAGDPKAKASGFTRQVHGWGAEIHLLGMIAKQLNAAGFGLVRKRLAGDNQYCHMFGDDHMCYLRTALANKRNCPHLWIIDENYAILSSSEEYNKGNEVRFGICGNIFQNRDEPALQPDWFDKVKTLCDAAGITCDLSKWCFPAPYQVIDVLVNFHTSPGTWTVGAYGCVDRDSTDDPLQLGDTEEATDQEAAIQEAELMVWRLLNDNKARRAVILLNGNEHAVLDLDENNRVVKAAEPEVVA